MGANSQSDGRRRNHDAYWRDKDRLAERYPAGWFVAYDQGKVIADAADFESLRRHLISQGKDPAQVLVVEAGVDYPKEVVIF
jgi:hypothetical protein